MNRTCVQCSQAFEITNEDLAFYDKVSPVFNGKKELIPPPTLCPECRTQKRMAFCNERFLYHNKCCRTGKPVISELHPENPIKIWNFHDWWSDAFSALDYGRQIDWGRSLLEQFYEMKLAIPHPSLNTDLASENSDYTHHAGHERNCYLMFHTSYAEDCMYGYGVKKCKSCLDNYYCHESELCYECVDVKSCYGLRWSQYCINCRESAFLYDCIGCQDCLLCVGLRNKKHCILNEQLTFEEYTKRKSELNLGSYAQVDMLAQTFASFKKKHPHKCLRIEFAERSTGDNLYKAKNCTSCFDCSDLEDCKYCAQLQFGSKSCHDIYQFGINIEQCYDCAMIGYNAYHCAFCYDLLDPCSELFYCVSSFASQHSLLCFGLRHHKYCILNKQYSKEEFEALAPRIIERMCADGEWGSFFPMNMSQLPYNDSTADLWYPMLKEEVLKRGLRYQEKDEPELYLGPKATIPDHITDADESICEKIFLCEVSRKPYKIIPQELKFHQEHGIALPRRAFAQRHRDRFQLRNPRKLWNRTCAKCAKAIQTTYAPERPEIVYCEKCYLETVY